MNTINKVSGISKFLFSTLVAAAAMTSTAWATTDKSYELSGDENRYAVFDEINKSGGSATIKFTESFESGALTIDFYGDKSGDIFFIADKPVTIETQDETKFIAEGLDPFTVTFGENVTFGGTDAVTVGTGANLKVEGTITGQRTLTLSGGTNTVTSTGTISTEAMCLSGGASLTVAGGNISLSQNLDVGYWGADNGGDTFKVENASVNVGDGGAFFGINLNLSGSVMEIVNSEVTTGNLYNNGTITISGNSTLNVQSITGTGTITVKEGAILTLSSSALFDNLTVENGATVNFGKVVAGSSVSLEENKEQTVIVAETGTVSLSTAAADIVVQKAEAVDVATISGIENENDLVAAWDFDIKNENFESITVSAEIEGLDKDTIKIWHGLGDGSWECLNEKEGFVWDYQNGTLTFTTNSFSPIVVEAGGVVPEPSAFGLLAGLGAIALAASRRRRRAR